LKIDVLSNFDKTGIRRLICRFFDKNEKIVGFFQIVIKLEFVINFQF